MADLTLLNIDNAADYFWTQETRDIWESERFPCVVPPWPNTWIEYRMPAYGVYKKGKTLGKVPLLGSHDAILALTTDPIPEEFREKALREDWAVMVMRMNFGLDVGKQADEVRKRREMLASFIADGTRVKWITLWCQWRVFGGRRIVPWSACCFYLDESGHALDTIGLYALMEGRPTDAEITRVGPDGVHSYAGSLMLPFKYALALLNCKNTEIIKERSAPRKRSIQQREPEWKFHRLVVHPIADAIRYKYGQKQERRPAEFMPLHIQRGHFKDYRDGPGLFGQYKGIWWWMSHVRGAPEVGVVEKDYVLQMPEGVQ